ncbi:synaptopodin-2 isoform X2 [Xyrauchen texanus]|uniref:synaptopodin-2 isoform X2 n=1 Tax=Xyrauchen texanus TaxID=154827 RepID=UPI002241AE0F|nr:synaptopodin-2 isoform X2 [Xyrauchen texanus]
MGTGDYVCVTLRGGMPWGFRLRQSAQEPQHLLQVFEIEDGSPASQAGLCENDELLSVNGKPCSNFSLSKVIDLIEASTDCLLLLVKRCCSQPQTSLELVSTTLKVPTPPSLRNPQENYISESQDKAYFGETDSDAECPGRSQLVRMQIQVPASRNKSRQNTSSQGDGDTRLEVTPGSVVELQLSLSKTTMEEPECTLLGSACGVVGEAHQRKTSKEFNFTTTSYSPDCPVYIPRQDRKPLGQRGVLVSKPSALQKQVDVTLLQLSGSSSGKEGVQASDRLDSAGEEGGYFEEAPTSSSVSFGLPSEEWDSESEREVNKPNKHRARHARLRRSESLSEKQVKEAKSKCKRIALLLSAPASNPNNKGVLMFKKHRQRAKKYTIVSYGTGEDEPDYKDGDDDEKDNKEKHAVEFTVLATSETEIDEDFFTNASGQKSIVTFDWDTGLLEIERNLDNYQDMEELPDTKGKGALMFAQRRQRMDEIVAEHEELRRKGIPVEGLKETETHQTYHHMEDRGYMNAQETQNYMDVNVHHSTSAQKQQQHQQYHQYQEQYYQQQQQQQQHYQDYQKQLQYQQHQQQQYQQQPDYQQQKNYQHVQSCNQQQHFQQHQVQQHSQHMNGNSDQQINEMQPSVTNRSAKPFSVQNKTATPFSSLSISESQEQSGYSFGQGEQIASRDERISVPAIKTGILQDTRRRNANKPMFTFKESPKVSPSPVLLNLLNKNDKKAGFESGPDEDYLSLGAEACNFLQSPKIKHKIPPPVAPKPHINAASPPWSVQPETTGHLIPQQTENNGPASAEAPATEADAATAPVPEMVAPNMSEQEPSPSFAPESQDVPLCPEQPAPDNAWKPPATPVKQNQQAEIWNEKMNSQLQMNSAHPAALPPANAQSDQSTRTWEPAPSQCYQQVSAWDPTEMQTQVPSQNQSEVQPSWMSHAQSLSEVHLQAPTKTQPQPTWVTQASIPPNIQPQTQTQPQSHMSSWTPVPNQSTLQPPWSLPHEPAQPPISVWHKDHNQAQEQPAWVQQQQFQGSQVMQTWASTPQQQPQSPWAHPQSQPQSQPQPHPSWISYPNQQEPTQPPANAWTQPQSLVHVQPLWAQQTQIPPQPSAQMEHPMNSWAPMPAQSQPPWAQQPVSPQHPQQMNSYTPVQNHIQASREQPPNQAQVQPPWAQQTQQQASQPPVSQWASLQSQSQPGVNAWVPKAETQKFPPQPIKPLNPPQSDQPTPPRRMNSYTSGTKEPSPTPPSSSMSGFGSAFEMPALRGKGAELFAKRQSRMEKYIVDSTTVQANKVLRSSSLSPPVRLSSVGFTPRSVSSSPSPRPAPHAVCFRPPVGQTGRLDRGYKPLTPWEAASRHPLGLVDAAFAFLDLPQSIASNLRYAAQSKLLPEPPAEWKAKVAYQPPPKNLKESMSQSPLSFLSPTKSTASAPAGPIPYGSTFRQGQPQRSLTEANLGPSQGDQKDMGPHRLGLCKAKDSSTWRIGF